MFVSLSLFASLWKVFLKELVENITDFTLEGMQPLNGGIERFGTDVILKERHASLVFHLYMNWVLQVVDVLLLSAPSILFSAS